MKKYRISVKDSSKNDQRVLPWNIFTSKKKAQAYCDTINSIEKEREAQVIVKEK